MADTPTPTLREIADRVWVWLQPGGESGVSNAGVVADDDGLTVIDTLMVRSQWEPFAAAVKSLGSTVKRVVLTHAHIDHVGGTTAFRNAMVLGSPMTSDLLDQAMPVDAYKAFMPAFAEGFDELAVVGTRPVSHVVDDAAQLTTRIELLPARGHTDGDLMVLIADSDVLFAGDLCFFGVTPLAFQGDPAAWANVLDVVGELAATIVPGHGPIGGAAEVAAFTRLPPPLRHGLDPRRSVGSVARTGRTRSHQRREGRDAAGGRRRHAAVDAPGHRARLTARTRHPEPPVPDPLSPLRAKYATQTSRFARKKASVGRPEWGVTPDSYRSGPWKPDCCSSRPDSTGRSRVDRLGRSACTGRRSPDASSAAGGCAATITSSDSRALLRPSCNR